MFLAGRFRTRSLLRQFDVASNPYNAASAGFSSSWSESSPRTPKKPQLPASADVVIIGGGIIGTSVAYHLATIGIDNVVLLERHQLTSGTTWHAAGLMNAFGSLSRTSTWMRQYTQDLYQHQLRSEDGTDTCGWRGIGLLEIAHGPDRWEHYRRVAAANQYWHGDTIQVQELTAVEMREHVPLLQVDDAMDLGFYVPNDGRANPTDATQALAKAAKRMGVQIHEHAAVERVERKWDGNMWCVEGVTMLDGHTIATDRVVNCAGMWARQLAEASGVHTIPNQAAEHYYIITEPMPDVDPDWPVVEDPSKCVYVRPESGGLMFGLFESEGSSWSVDKVPDNFAFGEIAPDMERIAPYVEAAMDRIPAAQNVGIKSFFCGPESFTPDGNPIVGESNQLRNYFVAAGMNSLGILTGGGIGHIMASWVKNGHAPDEIDVTGINADRFHSFQSNPSYRRQRAGEILGETYKTHYPHHQLQTCRNSKRSALHDQLAAANGFFRDVSGWESPMFYGQGSKNEGTFGRPDWFSHWEREHLGCRNHVALLDMSFMSKFLVQGRDAGSFLNMLSTANVDGEAGLITYTQWLNERGYMEADLTVTKLDNDSFLVVATDTMHNHVYNHMRRRVNPKEQFVSITDVTGRYSQINVQGPRSRELLQKVTSCDMNDLAFRDVREIDMDLARVICARITYVGELGYELFVPAEQAHIVYDQILGVGAEFGLVHAGLSALGSLRLEKGYRDYGHDMDNTDTLLECGLGFTCDFNKEVPFVGQAAVLKQRDRRRSMGGLPKRMVSVLLGTSDHMLHHGEVIWRDGIPVSDVRAASFGHTLGSAVGLAMLESSTLINKAYLEEGEWAVGVGGQRLPCRVSLSPFYDPKGQRIKN